MTKKNALVVNTRANRNKNLNGKWGDNPRYYYCNQKLKNVKGEVVKDVGSVDHSETDGVCRAEVGAGFTPALTPLKSGWGVKGGEATLGGLPINLNYITRLTMTTMERGK
jgi:hypothetical protein